MASFAYLKGCRLHNLKNVDAQFPLGKVTVVCGPSGCGKSTLVLDTLHGESKRRYLETLSPFAAEFLGGKRTIPLDSAEGLPASLAIGPTRGEAPAKASALSIAECDNALRTLFAAFAKPACPICAAPMESETREEIIRTIAGMDQGSKLQFFAKINPAGNTLDKLSAVFLAQGYTRAYADGVSYTLADLTDNEKHIKPAEFFVVVDRIIVRENTRTRIAEAVDATLKLTHSHITLDISGERRFFSTLPYCPNANDAQHQAKNTSSGANDGASNNAHNQGDTTLAIAALEARSFSPYNRASACDYCQGTGIANTNDCIPDKQGKTKNEPNSESKDAPKELSDSQSPCPHCKGLRLKKPFLNASIDGIRYQDILQTTFSNLPNLLKQVFTDKIAQNLRPTYTTLMERVEAVVELGIGYLTPGRSGQTLSGGEIQRLKLACLSTGHLNGLLIALDEPASGLHDTDVEALWNVLEKVCKRGNTLVLIEHNPSIIRRADYIIEMGPGAGEKGGEILFQGTAKEVLQNPESPTAKWIRELEGSRLEARGPRSNARSPKCDARGTKKATKEASKSIEVRDFALYDMEKVSASFPLNKFSVITGQSGSGKSTLLFENIARRASAQEFASIGIEALSILTTGDFHGNRRSSVLSATGLMPTLRDLFAKMPESKVRGYTASKFSTHAPGGRCENCKGEGVIYDPSGYEESECPVCLGKRFRDEVLEIRFKSFSIADILDMEIGNAYKILANLKPFAEKMKPLVETGLEYIKLGQTTAHLSGGERSRLRLSIALARAKAPHTLFLFDEPARGLHQKDIQQLLQLFKELCKQGHTVIAIEHSADFVNAADYSIELFRKK